MAQKMLPVVELMTLARSNGFPNVYRNPSHISRQAPCRSSADAATHSGARTRRMRSADTTYVIASTAIAVGAERNWTMAPDNPGPAIIASEKLVQNLLLAATRSSRGTIDTMKAWPA